MDHRENLSDHEPQDELNPLWQLIKETTIPAHVETRLRNRIQAFENDLDRTQVNTPNAPETHGSFRLNFGSLAGITLSAVAVIWILITVFLVRSETLSSESTTFASSRSSDDDKPMAAAHAAGNGSSRVLLVAFAPKVSDGKLLNGDFESKESSHRPSNWMFLPERKEYRISLESEGAFQGSLCARIQADPVSESGYFVNLMQAIDAAPYLTKRVRFRAAVRVVGGGEKTHGHLWLRADAKGDGGNVVPVLFDNMEDRPITSAKWSHYEIVGEIPSGTNSISIGFFLIGPGELWIDDASFDLVDDTVRPTTVASVTTGTANGRISSPPRPEEPTRIVLMGMVGVLIALVLMVASQVGTGYLLNFSLIFSLSYWVLYSQLSGVPILGMFIARLANAVERPLVSLVAKNLLGIERTLTMPNGSGDTTYDYVRVYCLFVASILIAFLGIAVAIPGRKWLPFSMTGQLVQERLRDLLYILLRYTLAAILLGYGLAKITTSMNQFPAPGIDQLLKPWGDSSPMNVLWTFMGSSRAYTFFAGLSEVIPAVLLLSRRTSVLGAAIAFGVMLNIFLLNLCYDVPVKQFSFHLIAMSLVILSKDFARLFKVIVLNQAAQPAQLGPSYSSDVWTVIHYCFKGLVLLISFIAPIGFTLYNNLNSSDPLAQPPLFGAYGVESMSSDGEIVEKQSGNKWQRLHLDSFRDWQSGAQLSSMRVYLDSASPQSFSVNYDESTGKIVDKGSSKNQLELKEVEEGRVQASGTWNGTKIDLTMKKIRREDFLLFNRGFRWINERPFNR